MFGYGIRVSRCPAWVRKEMRVIHSERDDDTITPWQDVDRLPPAGPFIVDFDTQSGRPKFTGLWQVLEDRHIHRAKNGSGELLLTRKVNKLQGLKIGGLVEWQRAAAKALESGADDLQIADFARTFLT